MKKVYKEGDIFAISLAPNGEDMIKFKPPYIFGRLIAINRSKDMIVEIFNYVGNLPDNLNEILDSGRLFEPIDVIDYQYKNRWRVVARSPNYSKDESNYKDIKFDLGSCVWVEGKARMKELYEQKQIFPKMINYHPLQVEKMIKEKLHYF